MATNLPPNIPSWVAQAKAIETKDRAKKALSKKVSIASEMVKQQTRAAESAALEAASQAVAELDPADSAKIVAKLKAKEPSVSAFKNKVRGTEEVLSAELGAKSTYIESFKPIQDELDDISRALDASHQAAKRGSFGRRDIERVRDAQARLAKLSSKEVQEAVAGLPVNVSQAFNGKLLSLQTKRDAVVQAGGAGVKAAAEARAAGVVLPPAMPPLQPTGNQAVLVEGLGSSTLTPRPIRGVPPGMEIVKRSAAGELARISGQGVLVEGLGSSTNTVRPPRGIAGLLPAGASAASSTVASAPVIKESLGWKAKRAGFKLLGKRGMMALPVIGEALAAAEIASLGWGAVIGAENERNKQRVLDAFQAFDQMDFSLAESQEQALAEGLNRMERNQDALSRIADQSRIKTEVLLSQVLEGRERSVGRIAVRLPPTAEELMEAML